MPEEISKTTKFLNALKAKALAIAAIVGMVVSVAVFDDRYAKEEELQGKFDTVQDTIVEEMRKEVTKNRTAMISNMQRDADDIGFTVVELEAAGTPVPRYLREKLIKINRDIERLNSNE